MVFSPALVIFRTPLGRGISISKEVGFERSRSAKSMVVPRRISFTLSSTSWAPAMSMLAGSMLMRFSAKPLGWCTVFTKSATDLRTITGMVTCTVSTLRERYREAVTDLAEGDLYGEWEVKRLVSYQDGWRGRNGLVYGTEYKEEDGGNFYPESYLGNTVWIGNTGVELHDGDGRMTGSIRTDGYSSRMVDKYDYQNGKGIHDELGLTNEEIQVFAGNIPAPDGAVLDGEIVAVSRTEIIMKIYQGWYLLKKLPV